MDNASLQKSPTQLLHDQCELLSQMNQRQHELMNYLGTYNEFLSKQLSDIRGSLDFYEREQLKQLKQISSVANLVGVLILLGLIFWLLASCYAF